MKNLFHPKEVIEIITREVDIEMNPQELAEEFWNMDSKQQADFFNILAGIIEENQGRGVMQLDFTYLLNLHYIQMVHVLSIC